MPRIIVKQPFKVNVKKNRVQGEDLPKGMDQTRSPAGNKNY